MFPPKKENEIGTSYGWVNYEKYSCQSDVVVFFFRISDAKYCYYLTNITGNCPEKSLISSSLLRESGEETKHFFSQSEIFSQLQMLSDCQSFCAFWFADMSLQNKFLNRGLVKSLVNWACLTWIVLEFWLELEKQIKLINRNNIIMKLDMS